MSVGSKRVSYKRRRSFSSQVLSQTTVHVAVKHEPAGPKVSPGDLAKVGVFKTSCSSITRRLLQMAITPERATCVSVNDWYRHGTDHQLPLRIGCPRFGSVNKVLRRTSLAFERARSTHPDGVFSPVTAFE